MPGDVMSGRVFTTSEKLLATSLTAQGKTPQDIAAQINAQRAGRQTPPNVWPSVCACQVRDFGIIRTHTLGSGKHQGAQT